MKVLAVLPDSNAIDRVAHIAGRNIGIIWDIIGIREDCMDVDTDWAHSFICLHDDSRIVVEEKPVGIDFDYQYTQFEQSCLKLDEPLLKYWFAFDRSGLMYGIWELGIRLYDYDPDIVVMWGDRCWYNEVTKEWARKNGKPVCFLERASFPGMLVAESTGIEQHCSDLRNIQDIYELPADFQEWKNASSRKSIEPQIETTTFELRNMIGNDENGTFVPLQVPYDTNMVYRTGVINTNSKLLEYVCDHGYDNVVVKKHPGDVFTDNDKLKIKCEEYGFKLIDASIFSILSISSCVVSINSQVIVDAWLNGVENIKILGQPAFDNPDIECVDHKLAILRDKYFIHPHQLYERLEAIEQMER
jgi:hypothetical protein